MASKRKVHDQPFEWVFKFYHQGEFFNDEELRIMLAREAEEERIKREEDYRREELEEVEATKSEKKRKQRGIIMTT